MYNVLDGRPRVRREQETGGDERQQARITFILLLLASYLFLWGFPTLGRTARGPLGLEERGTSSDSRTRVRAAEAAAAAALRPSLVSRLPEIPLSDGGERETPCPLNGVTGLPWLR